MFTDNLVDAGGSPIEGLPPKRVTVAFDDLDGKTRLRVHVQLESAADLKKLVDMGFAQHFPETLLHLEQLLDNVKSRVSRCNEGEFHGKGDFKRRHADRI